MNTRSIRFRLLTWYAGLLTVIFLVLGALLYLNLRHFLENDLRDSQMRRAQRIVDTLVARIGQTGDASFAGQVKELYEPEISGRDNLETLALCEAVFSAAQEHRVTTVQEFLTR